MLCYRFEIADKLIEKAFKGCVHTYPSLHGQDDPCTKTAWEILDTIRPGVLSPSARALLAGYITGAIEKAKRR